MKQLFTISSYIQHLLRSKSKYKIHSPFIYDLVSKVFRGAIPPEVSEKIASIRKHLLADDTILKVVDFGAGSKNKINKKTDFPEEKFKSVKEITKKSLLRQKYSKMLYNLVRHYKPKTIVELGTSLGLTSGMMALASESSKLYTLEGCEDIATVAQRNFNRLEIKNIEQRIGEFSITLPELLSKLEAVDLVFFDGNHRKEPTINYFESFLPLKHNDSIFIFDDIHWSKGMEEAWEYIKNHPDTIVTMDIFFMGIVFFRKELSPQHFIYRF